MKRYLNKIIFIKSANIDYQEILVDGNVHFTGDQGVGKSTVLRAILFFYNARGQQLGIPRTSNKSPFDEYYFQHAYSHIVYEVKSGHATFLVWLYKEGNKLSYRFINSSFKQYFFLEQTVKGTTPLLPNKVLEKVRTETSCSRKIVRFKEFRDILYGAVRSHDNTMKPFRQYALMESSVYHNIPKTISNVFLNSKLQSDVIKTTIINSISEDEYQSNEGKGYRIDLNVKRAQLSDFKHDYDDIADFEKIRKRAESIIGQYDEIRHLEEQKILTARHLGASVRTAAKMREEWEVTIKTNETRRLQHEDRKEHIKQQHRVKSRRLEDELAIVGEKITTTRKKINRYREQDIEQILRRVSHENGLARELTEKETQKRGLEAAFESIEQKYHVLTAHVDNEKAEAANLIRAQINDAARKLTAEKERMLEEFQTFLDALDTQRERQIEEAERDCETLRETLNSLEQSRRKIQSAQYFQQEIDDCITQRQTLEQSIPKKKHAIQLNTEKIASFGQQADYERERTQTASDHQRDEILRQQQVLRTDITDITSKLHSFENSFYEFLNQNYPGWENTIGKICTERILFENGLNPVLEQETELCYGVRLDLADVENPVKTIAEYEQEQQRLEKELLRLDEQSAEIARKQELKQQNISKRFNGKIRPLKKENLTIEAEIQQMRFQIERLEVELEDLDKKAVRQKEEHLTKITPKIVTIKSQHQEGTNRLKALKKRFQTEKEQKKKAQQERLRQLERQFHDEEQELQQQVQSIEQKYAVRKQQLEQQKYAELEGKGLDTSHIQVLAERMREINTELDEIKRLRQQYVGKYEHDKEEYIDRLPEFENREMMLKNELHDVNTRYKTERGRLDTILTQLGKILKNLTAKDKEICAQLQAFETFKSNELYHELEPYILDTDTPHHEENLTTLTNSLTNLAIQLNSKHERFQATVNAFVSPFREDNIFHFPRQFSDHAAYDDFAKNLKEFVEEDKIERYKQDVKKMHADLIRDIVQDIDELMSKRKEVDETIARMNKDFDKSNFVGVVQKVELRTDDSENTIVQTFLEIKKFNDDNPFGFGTPDLFTGLKLEENNEKALRLLTTLLKNLAREEKRAEITLEDTFELKFRVIENQKNTGWQTRLTDIGSNGTDILVKVMIYIMLLNVFKEKASKKFKDFTLHCLMDEIGVIHPKNIESLIRFANERDIWMINGSPVENNAHAYRHVYDFAKNAHSVTRASRLITRN